MRLSVVIPCYNELNTIGEVLNSVLGYSGTEKEIIIVDDGSTDGTRQFLQEQVDGKLARLMSFMVHVSWVTGRIGSCISGTGWVMVY